MSNKLLALFDKNHITESTSIRCSDEHAFDTDIQVRDEVTGKLLYRTKNKIIIPGAGLIAKKIVDLPNFTEVTPTYNQSIPIYTPSATQDPQPSVEANTAATATDNRILLFCIGIDGCGTEN